MHIHDHTTVYIIYTQVAHFEPLGPVEHWMLKTVCADLDCYHTNQRYYHSLSVSLVGVMDSDSRDIIASGPLLPPTGER